MLGELSAVPIRGLYASVVLWVIEGLVDTPIVNRRFHKYWSGVFWICIWTVNQLSIRIVEPEKDIIFRICYDGVAWNRWLMELLKKVRQTLVGIIAHRVLEGILHHLVFQKCFFHRSRSLSTNKSFYDGIYHFRDFCSPSPHTWR